MRLVPESLFLSISPILLSLSSFSIISHNGMANRIAICLNRKAIASAMAGTAMPRDLSNAAYARMTNSSHSLSNPLHGGIVKHYL